MTRREVLRKAVFVAPVILTLPVTPSFARAGSTGGHEQGGATTIGDSQSGESVVGAIIFCGSAGSSSAARGGRTPTMISPASWSASASPAAGSG